MVAQTNPEDRLLTLEDLELLPDDGQRYELLQGELIESPAPGTQHQRILRRIARVLDDAVIASGFGEMFQSPYDARLSPHNIVQPDLLVIGRSQMQLLTEHRFEGAPELVIEVISPSSELYDRVRKASLYMEAGVREYWIVDPSRKRIVIHRPRAGVSDVEVIASGYAVSRIIPGFTIEFDALFAPGPFELT